jgi:hypothetical protein
VRHVVALTAAVLLGGCADGGPGTSPEPLRLPQEFGFMAAPIPGPTFHSFDVCARGGPVRVRVVDIEAGRVQGTERVRFLVAWPRTGDQSLSGAGRLAAIEPLYEPAAGATGKVRSCADMAGPGMAIAAILPPARGHAVVVHDVVVTYTVREQRHTGTAANVRLGTCPSARAAGSTPTADC